MKIIIVDPEENAGNLDCLRDDALIVRIGIPAIEKKEDLFTQVQNFIDMPDYFGYNWDALEELMRDIDIVKYNRLVIIWDNVFHTLKLDCEIVLIFLEILRSAFQDDESDNKVLILNDSFIKRFSDIIS